MFNSRLARGGIKFFVQKGGLAMEKYGSGKMYSFAKDTNLMDPDFRKSSLCHPTLLPPCVSVAIKGDVVGVRDTKDKTKTTLLFTHDEWNSFIAGVKKGDFDIK